MTGRDFITWLAALIVPVALALMTLDAARAGPPPVASAMAAAAAAGMADCRHEGMPGPAKVPACGPDCPLICAPPGARPSALEARIRPQARLHYDLALQGLEGRALEPELPPPRRGPT